MIKIRKELCGHFLKSLADLNLTASLVIKHPETKTYVNGDEFNLQSKRIYKDLWKFDVDESSNIYSMSTDELVWVSDNDVDVEVVGYFVFSEQSVLFFEVFKESIFLEQGRPFSIRPCLALSYHPDDNDFLDVA